MAEEDFGQNDEMQDLNQFKYVKSICLNSSDLNSIQKNNKNLQNDTSSQFSIQAKSKISEECKDIDDQMSSQQIISGQYEKQGDNLDSSSSKFSSIQVKYPDSFQVEGYLSHIRNFIQQEENQYICFSQSIIKLVLSKDEKFKKQQNEVLNILAMLNNIFQKNQNNMRQFLLDFSSYQYLDSMCLGNLIQIYDRNSFNKIEQLTLKLRGEINSQGFKDIVQPLNRFREMQILSLQLFKFDNIRKEDIDLLVKSCLNMKSLQSFKLNLQDCTTLDDTTLSSLSGLFLYLQELEEIQLVSVDENKFTNEGISKLLLNKKLKRIDLRLMRLNYTTGNQDYNQNDYEKEQIEKISKKINDLVNLESFKLEVRESNNITDISVQKICYQLKKLRHLKVLNLQFKFVKCFTEKTLKKIISVIGSKKNQLKTLVIDFSFSKFSQVSMGKLIASLQNQSQLTKLKLYFNDVESIQKEQIKQLSIIIDKMTFLSSLSLNFNHSKIGIEIMALISVISLKQNLQKIRLFLRKIDFLIEQKKQLCQEIQEVLPKKQCFIDFGQGLY